MSRSAELLRLIATSCANEKLKFEPAANRGSDWKDFLNHLAYVPVGYARRHTDYQHAYFSAFNPEYAELDCLITWQGTLIGLWPLAWAGGRDGQNYLSSHINGSVGVAPPLLCGNLSEKQEKAVTRAWLGIVAALSSKLVIPAVNLVPPRAQHNLPHWHSLCMSHGAAISCKHQLIADLTLTEDEYHRRLRKSYKAQINAAEGLWQVAIDVTGNPDAFAQFQGLHESVAGRKTRPIETWQAQFDAITAGEAFAVYLRDSNGRMVGASLFNCSRNEAYYAVGAYDRTLFHQPLAHLSLYKAVCFAKQSGLDCLLLGQRVFPSDREIPSTKEEQISFFKEGFATATQLIPELRLSATQIQSLAMPAT